MANTESSSMRSLSGKRSCCSRSSYSSAPWWRWAAAALADWRSPCSSHREPLLFYCAPLAHRQKKAKEKKISPQSKVRATIAMLYKPGADMANLTNIEPSGDEERMEQRDVYDLLLGFRK